MNQLRRMFSALPRKYRGEFALASKHDRKELTADSPRCHAQGLIMFLRYVSLVKETTRAIIARCEASVGPMFGIAVVPLLAMVGAAVDYTRANDVRTTM